MAFQNELISSLSNNGSKTAIEKGSERVTYSGLRDRADALTGFFLQRGNKPNILIGVLLRDRVDLITALIGVMNARCVFVPLDGNWPSGRLTDVVRDFRPDYILCSRRSPGDVDNLRSCSTRLIFIEDFFEDGTGKEDFSYPEYEPDDSIYIYFTSGTTGRPKGIIGKNSSLLQFLRWEIREFGIDDSIRVSQFVSPYFDAFLRDIFVPLLTGGTICIPPGDKDSWTPETLTAWIDAAGVNLIHCVPSLFRVINNELLTPGHFGSLKYVMLSGEKIIPAELVPWYRVFGPRIALVNFYGATETTLIRVFYRIRPEDATLARIPIGSPIDDTELLIAGEDMRPCATLASGDLYIITDYTSKGYLNAPELTAEKFIRLPGPGGGLVNAYKTGDKARLLPGGKIDLIGRDDRQIKLRGIRIELDEVEQVLLGSGLVKSAVVVLTNEGTGNESLSAFVCGREDKEETSDLEVALRSYLKNGVPDYMIPSTLSVVEAIPLLANGKINYKALTESQRPHSVVPPADSVEEEILIIWKEVLGDGPISVEDSFLSIGGNSIGIMKLIGRLYKKFNVRVSLGDLFSHLTVRRQADLIRVACEDESLRIRKAGKKPGYALSSAQERIYYDSEMDKSSTAYNLPMIWEIKGVVDKGRIQRTLDALIGRHESLRTEFQFLGGELLQVIRDTVDFRVEEISGDGEITDVLSGAIRPFDLSKAPLLRCAVVSSGESQMLLLDIHHIVCDGISQSILIADFTQLYRGSQLKELTIQYKDYAEWEHHYRTTNDYIRNKEFWLKMYEGEIPQLELPVLQLPTTSSYEGGAMRFEIGRSGIEPILEMWKRAEITDFSGWFSLFCIFLSQLTGQDDLIAGINTSGRMQDELEGVVGMFVKTLPIRCRLSPDMSFFDFSKEIHRYLVEAVGRQIYDLSDIRRALNSSRGESVGNLIDAMFVYLDFGIPGLSGDNVLFIYKGTDNSSSKYPLTLFANSEPEYFLFRMEYSFAFFSTADAGLLIRQFSALVAAIAKDPGRKVFEYLGSDLPSSYAIEDSISFNF